MDRSKNCCGHQVEARLRQGGRKGIKLEPSKNLLFGNSGQGQADRQSGAAAIDRAMTDPPSDLFGATPGITYGARRVLYDLDYDTLTEFKFRTGYRADITALHKGGEIVVVEVKSSVADFKSDSK